MLPVPILNIFVKYWNVQREVVIVRDISVSPEGVVGCEVCGKFFESGRIVDTKTNAATFMGGKESCTLECVYASHGRRKRDAKRLGEFCHRHGTARAESCEHFTIHPRAEHVKHEGGVFSRVSCRIGSA